MSITSAGVGSGLPLEDMITTFVETERMPRENRINQQEYDLETQISGVGTFKSAVAKFDGVLQQLSDPDLFLQNKNTITYQGSSEENLPFSVTTSDLVARGSFQVTVDQLAEGSQMKSAALAIDPSVDAIGSGNLTFSTGAGNDFIISVDPADSLEDIRDKINSAGDNFGVQANIINTDSGAKLVYNSEVTGLGNDLTVSTDDASLDAISTNMVTTSTAKNAEITVDGELISSSTNKFSNAISGLNIEVTSLTDQVTGESATLDIANDVEGVKELITQFVDGYNELKDQLKTLSDPETGLLAFDSSVRNIQGQLSSILSGVNSDAPTGLQSLFELGVSVDNSGYLEISSLTLGDKSGTQRLDDALESNLRGVGTLFASDNGIATRLAELTDNYVGDDGTLVERALTLESERSEIQDSRDELDAYIEEYEAGLRKKYAALDSVMAEYQATSGYLTSIFANLNNNSDD